MGRAMELEKKKIKKNEKQRTVSHDNFVASDIK